MNDAVKLRRDGAILEVTLDRPKANAIDVETSVAMGEAFVAFRDDPDLRVAILTGGGEKFFCAGTTGALLIKVVIPFSIRAEHNTVAIGRPDRIFFFRRIEG